VRVRVRVCVCVLLYARLCVHACLFSMFMFARMYVRVRMCMLV